MYQKRARNLGDHLPSSPQRHHCRDKLSVIMQCRAYTICDYQRGFGESGWPNIQAGFFLLIFLALEKSSLVIIESHWVAMPITSREDPLDIGKIARRCTAVISLELVGSGIFPSLFFDSAGPGQQGRRALKSLSQIWGGNLDHTEYLLLLKETNSHLPPCYAPHALLDGHRTTSSSS
jgi:hypothetical protein